MVENETALPCKGGQSQEPECRKITLADVSLILLSNQFHDLHSDCRRPKNYS